jgi:hypothetical protein
MVAIAADQMGNVPDHDFITYGMRIHHRNVCGVIFQVLRLAEHQVEGRRPRAECRPCVLEGAVVTGSHLVNFIPGKS